MRARTDLWEPWAGNRPGSPGPAVGSGPISLGVKPWTIKELLKATA